MINPDLFDVVELLVDISESGLQAGDSGAIVEKYSDRAYEVEFTNPEGETLALHTLSPEQFIVVWQAKTQTWVSISDRITAAVQTLSEERQQEVLNFTRSLYKN
ncbi:MAG: DUF4926 domain-containing protein [Lyngbya sp.]|nr:DUF4926 domain-containing protein [Lyngbya sp.]